MARLALSSEPLNKIKVRKLLECWLTLILLSIHSVTAGPAGSRGAAPAQCLSFCKPATNFIYEPGTTYAYEYTTDLATGLAPGTAVPHKSYVRVTATAELEAVSTCDLKLTLKNVRFEDLTVSSGGEEYSPLTNWKELEAHLEQNALLFGFNDGKVEQVCSNELDPLWVVNVKRGVISLVQNTLDDLSSSGFVHETDINGKCPTEYVVERDSAWGGGVTYRKIKDLIQCSGRQTQLSGVQSVPYSSSSPVQSIPLLEGRLECEQTVRGQRIESARCHETQRFQPFEDDNSGSITTVAQTLSYVSERPAPRHSNDESGVFRKSSLMFESTEESDDGTLDNSSQVVDMLNLLEAASFPQVNPQAPLLFSDLVNALRTSNEASIGRVFSSVEGTGKEQYLMEALPLVATASSLAFLRDLTLKERLESVAQKGWLTSLAFIKQPNVAMLKAVTPLIQQSNPSMEALLGVSALVYSYCKYHPACNSQVVVNDILQKLTAPLGTECRVDSTSAEQVRQVVLRLKALGNAGVLPVAEQVSDTPLVIQCLQQRSNPIEVRLAALDSLRRLPCDSYDSEDVLRHFTDVTEETEVRIKAFLTLMRCVNRHTMELVKSLLTTEPVNQVGSFVWTYLTNLQETNRPEKQELRDLVSNEFLKAKFSTDARKFSRNFEASTFWPEWNVGAGLDSNVIFTEESFLPKSGDLNLTLQLFGESVNIFQFGLRTHGMESLLEKFFGPDGYLPDERVTEFLHRRSKRETETDGLGYLYDQARVAEEEKTPGGSLYTRMFGHEVMYKQFEVSDNTAIPSVVDDGGNSWFNIRHIIDNLSSGKRSEFSRHAVLLDTRYSVPTSAGFPLGVSVHAAATLALLAKGRFNVARYIESRELDIEGTLRPSTMVHVDGTLAIQFGEKRVESGLKLHNTLRSSTALELSLFMKGKNVIRAAINVPQQKQEIIDVSSQLLVLGPNGELTVDEDKDEGSAPPVAVGAAADGCTAPFLSDLLGMRLCLQMNIPDKIELPPTRPVYLKLFLEKVDDFTGYTLDYRYHSDPTTTTLNAVIDTPGSLVNRRLSADFLLDRGLGKIAGALESARTALRAEGIYTRFQKNLELVLSSDEKPSFLLSAGLRSDRNVVKPHFLITWHSRPVVDLKGTIDMTPQSPNQEKMTIEMNLKHLTETPVKVTGEIIGGPEQKEATLAIESYLLTGNVHATLKRKPEHWSAKTSMEYSWKRGKVHTADLSAKLQRTRKGTLTKAQVTAGFSSTQFPDNGADFFWETQTSSGFCENTLKLSWGKTAWEGHTLFSRQNQIDHSELRFESSLQCLKFGLDYRLEFAHRTATEGFRTQFLGRTAPEAELKAHIEYLSAVDDLLKKVVDASATWPQTDYSLKASFVEKARGTFEAELLVHLNNTRDLKATALYINRSNNLRLDHSVEFRARGFTPVPLSGSLGFSATEKQSHVGLQLQFEGKKPYSSRMSTSLDYSHTKNSHKLEGKVTINERKYNGELLYVSTNQGSKNLTLDLQLEKHIFVQATLQGLLPNPMLATLLVVPDRDSEPSSKVRLEGNVDPQSIALKLDYFGEEMSVGGRYDDMSAMAEVMWPQDQKLMLAVALPQLSWDSALLEIDMETPWEGYRTITFDVTHSFQDMKLNTIAKGSMEEKEAIWNLLSTFASHELNIVTDLEVSGYPKYEAGLQLLRRAKRKSVQLFFKAGSKESLLDFFFTRLDEGFLGKFTFFGCPFFPRVEVELNHQFSESRSSNYNTKIEWGKGQQLAFQLKHQNQPLTVDVLFTSPWSPVRIVESSLSWDGEIGQRQFSLSVKENGTYANAKLELRVQGQGRAFSHELDGEWYGKAMRVTVSGELNAFTDANLHAVVKLPGHKVSYDLLSKRETPTQYLGEFRADVDNDITAAGVKWNMGEAEKLAQAWGQLPKHPPMSATVELIKEASGRRTAKLKVEKKDTAILDMISGIQIQGLRHWDADLVLESTWELVPSLSLSSKHDMLNTQKMSHVTKMRVTPVQEERFWLDSYVKVPRKGSVDLFLNNLEDLTGALIWADANFVLTGKIAEKDAGYESNLKLASNHWHTLTFRGAYSNDDDSFSASGQLNDVEGISIWKTDVELVTTDERKMAKVALSSAITAALEAFAELRKTDTWTLAAHTLKDEESVFHFRATGMASPVEGLLSSRLTSAYFPSISKLELDLDYQLARSGVAGKMRYQDNATVITGRAEGSWGDHVKVIKASYEGGIQFSFEAALEGMSELVATATYNGDKLGEVSIAYRPEQGDFSMGKHGVYTRFTDGSGVTHHLNAVVGLDTRKIFVNVQTPFTNWTDVVVDGQVASTSTTKEIRFTLQREGETIQGSFESRNSRKTGLRLSAELSVNGFSNLRRALLERAQATKIPGLSAVAPQRFTFVLNWAGNTVDTKVETPVELLKKLSLSANWEFKKSEKFLTVTGAVNEAQYELRTNVHHDAGNCKGKFMLTSDEYAIQLDYDLFQDYQLNLGVETPNGQWNVGGKLVVKPNQISFEVNTPFKPVETLAVSVKQETPTDKQRKYTLAWTLNGKADKMELSWEMEQGRVELRAKTPFRPWDDLVVTTIYDTPFRHFTFHAQRGDGSEVKLKLEVSSTGNLTQFESPAQSSILVAVETPVKDFEDIQFSVIYNRENSVHAANVSVSRNQGETEGKLNLMFQQLNPVALDISAFLSSPKLAGKATAHASLRVDPQGESTVSAHVQANGKRYEMWALSQLTSEMTKLEMRTSLPFLRQLKFTLKKGASITLHGAWTGNSRQLEVHGDILCAGFRQSRVSLNVSTPLDLVGSFGFEGEVSSRAGQTNAKLVFQNDEVRWLAKVDRVTVDGVEDWRLQVNTPLSGYKHVVASLRHALSMQERQLVGMVQLNKKEMSMRLGMKNAALDLALSSELSYLQLQAKISAQWEEALLLSVTTSSGNSEHGTAFQLHLQGISHGNLELAISSMEHLNTALDWHFEGDCDRGLGRLNLSNSLIGSKSFRVSWTNERWVQLVFHLWMKTGREEGEKGVTLQYQVTPHAKYGSLHAQANYTLSGTQQMKTIVFDGSLDEYSSQVNFDTVLKTPFPDWALFQARGHLKMKNEVGLSLDAKLNDKKLVVSTFQLAGSPLQSKLAVEMDAPLLTPPMQLTASYDLVRETKGVTLNFQQETSQVKCNLSVTTPQDSKVVEVSARAESNVPALPLSLSGDLRMEYVTTADGARQASIMLNGSEVGEWKLVGNLKTTDDVAAKLVFSAPAHLEPSSVLAEFTFEGTLAQGLKTDFTFILDDSELTAGLLLNKTQWRSVVKYLTEARYEYVFDAGVTFDGDETRLQLEYENAANFQLEVSGHLGLGSEEQSGRGVVTLTHQGETSVPLALEVKRDASGNLRLEGSSHEKNVRLEATLTGSEWQKEGQSTIILEGNIFGNETFEWSLKSSHFIRENEYSFNLTSGTGIQLESYLQTEENMSLHAKLDWDNENQVKLRIDLPPNEVNIQLSVPRYSLDAQLQATYGFVDATAFTNSQFLLNGQQSVLNASITRDGLQSAVKAFLDVPYFSQKLELEIMTAVSGPQNVRGSVSLWVNERLYEVTGNLKSQVVEGRYIQRVLTVSANLTSTTGIGLELFVRKPVKNFASLNVMAQLHVNEQVSSLSGGYELPAADNPHKSGIFAKLTSSYFPSDQTFEFFVKIFGKSLRKVEGKLNYRTTRFDALWDFMQPASVVSLSYAGHSDDGERLLVQLESILDLEQNVRLSLNCHGWDTHYTFRAGVTRQGSTVTGNLFLDAPQLIAAANEYKIIVTTNEDGSYGLEATAVRGPLIMELVGDVAASPTNLNIVVKARGSYGSHYAQVLGQRLSEGQYGFELTAESSSLLVGKRVNVRGNLTADAHGISTVLQCRARRNIHELTGAWRREEDGGRKLIINLSSPAMHPARLALEWAGTKSSEQAYQGKLALTLLGEEHTAELGLNLRHFEGKFHIMSPLLPGDEFNFHVKSVVSARNVDLMGDIIIRGSHWRLEGVAQFQGLRDMTFKIEARTPFAFFDRLTLGVRCVRDEVYLEVYTPASHLPSLLFQLGGLQALEQGRWYGLRPNLVISVPKGKYTARASFDTPKMDDTGKLHVLLEYAGEEVSKTLEAYADISPLSQFRLQMDSPASLTLRLVTPFQMLRQVRLGVEGEINSKRSGKLQVTGTLNSHEGQFDASFDNSNGNMQARTGLKTNIRHYEKSAFAIAIETFEGIGNGKSFHVEFRKPDWANLFRLDADYRYSFLGLTNLEGEVNVNMDSYMELPPLHAHVTSGMKGGRYSGALEGSFGAYTPALKVEAESLEEKINVFVEGKAGKHDHYNILNVFEMVPLQSDFSIKEQLHWRGEQVLDMQLLLSEAHQLCTGHVQMITPWGPVSSKAALSPITFLTLDEDLTLVQLMTNSNVTLEVNFRAKKLLGLQLVSRQGMRLFEVHNPLRPVSLSVSVERIQWNALRLKMGVCWDLNTPDTSSLGFDAYLYRRSTGLTMGGFLAAADYGIMTVMFEHFFVSSKLSQNFMIKWTAGEGRRGDLGYTLNITDRSTGFKRLVDYGFRLVVPSRSVGISGSSEGSEEKYALNNLAVAWDAERFPEKVIRFNVSSVRSRTWRSQTLLRTLQVQHVTWTEPLTLKMETTTVNELLKEIAFKVKPSTTPASHLSWSAAWEHGDWSSFVTTLVQPSSKIDLEARYNLTEGEKTLRVTHLLSSGHTKLFAATLERSDNVQNLKVEAGDVDQPRLLGAWNSQSDHKEHSIKANLLQYQVVGRVHTGLPFIDLQLRGDGTNKVHIIAGLPHSKEIVLKASRFVASQQHQDVNVVVRLNSSGLLSTRLHWRPDLLDELSNFDWIRGSKSLLGGMMPPFAEVSAAMRMELEGHWNLFSAPVHHFLTAFYQFSVAEVRVIFHELSAVSSRISELYARNAYYLRDMVQILKDSVAPIVKFVTEAVEQLKTAGKVIYNFSTTLGGKLIDFAVRYYGRLELHVMRSWEDVEALVIRLWHQNADWIQMVSETVEEWLDALIEALEGKIELLEEKLMAVGLVKTVLQLYRDYATWLDELPLDDYVAAVEEFFQIRVWDKIEALLSPYLESIRRALDDEYIKELLETPPIPYIRFVLKQTKIALVRLWDVIELEEKLKEIVRHALRHLDTLLQRNFPTWTLEWNPDDGIIEYDQFLSFIEWTDFTQPPRWRIPGSETEEVNQLANFYYQVMDYLEQLKPLFDLRLRDVLPPFGGVAMMAGDHHFYTFDQRYFRFAGECSYVLVADLLHNGFSFIVNYEMREGFPRKKSYTLALPNANVEFDAASFKVTVDNRKVELPTRVDTLYIRRQETRLDLYDTRGYQIRCTLRPSVCTFSTSGWYYGKLAGLLGTYDNEPVNDLRSPDGERLDDVSSFAYSWRVGKGRNQCRIKNLARDAEAEVADVDSICHDLLSNRNSPLRPCFNTVDTAVFLEMCKYDVSRNMNSAQRSESACTSMSAYVTQCQKHNVDVWMPPICVRCKLEDGSALTTGENATLQTNDVDRKPPSSSDIVILLEEGDCMDQLDLYGAVTKLEAALRAEGLTDNRYAVIGFGGEGIHQEAHLQTSSANVWYHSTLLKVPEKESVQGTPRPGDLYSAVHYASTMSYRAGVSKTLIAITCGDDKCGDSTRYADTLTLLVENDFKMHMLTPKPFILKGKKKVDDSNRVLGFDANGAYTLHHAKRSAPLVADPSFKRHLQLPKDLCTPLAVETNGTRFTTDQLSKKGVDLWARRVALTAHPTECQRCECVPDKNGESRLMCQQCVSPSLWKFMEEWKNLQSQEVDDLMALEFFESEPFLVVPN